MTKPTEAIIEAAEAARGAAGATGAGVVGALVGEQLEPTWGGTVTGAVGKVGM